MASSGIGSYFRHYFGFFCTRVLTAQFVFYRTDQIEDRGRSFLQTGSPGCSAVDGCSTETQSCAILRVLSIVLTGHWNYRNSVGKRPAGHQLCGRNVSRVVNQPVSLKPSNSIYSVQRRRQERVVIQREP